MKDLLRKLVAFKSNYPDEKEIGDFLYFFLISRGLKVEKFNIGSKKLPRNNLLISKQNSQFALGKKILLYGHLDTVDVVDGWKTDPYKLTIRENKAFGIGAYDMKTGLAIIINLLLLKEDLPVKAIFSVDEENICTGIHSLKNHSFLKDVAFALVPEPDFGMGLTAVCLGRTGRLVVQVKFFGEAKHMFFANSSINAIREAEIFDSFIKKIKFSQNIHIGKTIFTPRAFKAEAIGMSVPGQALIEYDLLTVPGDSARNVLLKFEQLASDLVNSKKLHFKPEIKLRDRLTPYLEPYEINKTNQYLKYVVAGIRKVTGKKAKYYYRSSVADENVLVNVHKIPSFTLGPSGGNAHGANEYINLDSMEKTYDIYLAIIRQYMESLK